MKKTLAVVTMVYNEANHLPRWLRHYEKQAELIENLHIVDHGSTDGSTNGLACNVIRLPREEGGGRLEAWRAEYISRICSEMLTDYEAVLFTDADELVVADPKRFASLAGYLRSGGRSNATIGYEVLHRFEVEAELTDKSILSQRNNLLFVASMCKPSLIRMPTKFSGGFHYSTEEPVFGDLYRFHLRYADVKKGLERLSVTRSLDRPEKRNVSVDHQKIDDQTYINWLNRWLSYPLMNDSIDVENEDVKAFIHNLNVQVTASGMHSFNYEFRAMRLVPVPPEFRRAV
jgi:hypothetical protein